MHPPPAIYTYLSAKATMICDRRSTTLSMVLASTEYERETAKAAILASNKRMFLREPRESWSHGQAHHPSAWHPSDEFCIRIPKCFFTHDLHNPGGIHANADLSCHVCWKFVGHDTPAWRLHSHPMHQCSGRVLHLASSKRANNEG